MKKEKILVITGIAIVVLGLTFHLQGQSIVGPESSFMYANPDWVTYGTEISIIGMIVFGVGLIIIKKQIKV